MPRTHVPVLAGELIEALDPQPGQVAVDCTLGAGGHARLVADRLGPAGHADRASTATRSPRRRSPSSPPRSRAARASSAPTSRTACELLPRRASQADLVYLDLGMSSMQVDTRERGFSYAYDAPLDMRMDPDAGAHRRARSSTRGSAAGSRARCASTARSATPTGSRARSSRRAGPLETTFELVDAITAAIPAPARFAGGHPAKRTFQAIRIAVNERARPARRGAAARVAAPARGRPAGRRSPSTRSRTGASSASSPTAPAGCICPPDLPGLRLRPHARGRARLPPLGRAHAGRGRREPAREVRAAARRPQAQGGALMATAHRRPALATPRRARGRCRATRAASPAPHRPARPARRRARRGRSRAAARTGAFERLARAARPPRLDRLLRGRAWIWLHRRSRSVGIVACRSRC